MTTTTTRGRRKGHDDRKRHVSSIFLFLHLFLCSFFFFCICPSCTGARLPHAAAARQASRGKCHFARDCPLLFLYLWSCLFCHLLFLTFFFSFLPFFFSFFFFSSFLGLSLFLCRASRRRLCWWAAARPRSAVLPSWRALATPTSPSTSATRAWASTKKNEERRRRRRGRRGRRRRGRRRRRRRYWY